MTLFDHGWFTSVMPRYAYRSTGDHELTDMHDEKELQ